MSEPGTRLAGIEGSAASVDMSRSEQSLRLAVTIVAIRLEAENVMSYELAPRQGALPAAGAGSHVDLYLANGLVRSYSLCNTPKAGENYVVAVALASDSRGGSSFMHQQASVGMHLSIGQPRNNFRLSDAPGPSIFVAGGIGITPILSMLHSLSQQKRQWRLHYFARSETRAPFRHVLQKLAAEGHGEVQFIYNDGPESGRVKVADVLAEVAPEAHLYCCGPSAMLQDFESFLANTPADRVHVERFAGSVDAAQPRDDFTIELARSNIRLCVRQGISILDTILAAGIEVPFSCKEGVCGACEVAVLDGVPEHRDMVLSEAEKAANMSILICCSTAQSERLVLDL